MSKNKTPTFIHELKLLTTLYQERKLRIKFRALRELYNTILDQAIKAVNNLKNDPLYQTTLKAHFKNKKLANSKNPKVIEQFKQEKKRINELFFALKEQYNVNKYYFQKIATSTKNKTYMKDHLDGDTVQVISDRAYESVENWLYGKRGKPRFKTWERGLSSISSKKNACLSFKNGKVKWKGLIIDVMYDKKDKHGVEAHALSQEIKYCRIVSRRLRGKDHYYLQLCLKGIPKQKYKINKKTVGIDIGVSTIAAVSKEKAVLEPFCLELFDEQKAIKYHQRLLARSLRLNNPQNYDKNGKIKKGKKTWHKSNNYKKINHKILELYRKQRDKRKYLHNVLANHILTLGSNIKIEKNNYKAWQKGWYGKTIGFRAPSAFVSTLKRKAESAGGSWQEINSFEAKLSQLCHQCDQHNKKHLSDRLHSCCNLNIQRDLYSGLLAYYTNTKNKVNTTRLRKEWESFDTTLSDAVLTLKNKLKLVNKHYKVPTSLGIA